MFSLSFLTEDGSKVPNIRVKETIGHVKPVVSL